MLESLSIITNLEFWNSVCDLVDVGVIKEHSNLVPEDSKLKQNQIFESVLEERGKFYFVCGWDDEDGQFVTIDKFNKKDKTNEFHNT